MRQLLLLGMAMVLAAAGSVEAQNGQVPGNGLNGAPGAAQDLPTQERDGYSVAPVARLPDSRPRTYEENGGPNPDPPPDCCEELRERVARLERRVEELETKHDQDVDRLEDLVRANADGIAENRASIAKNITAIESLTRLVRENSAAIASNSRAIGENAQGIRTNSADIASNRTGVRANRGDIGTISRIDSNGERILDFAGSMAKSRDFQADFYNASRATTFRLKINNETRPRREFDLIVNGTRWRVRDVPVSFVPLSEGPVTVQLPWQRPREIWSGDEMPRKDPRGFVVEISSDGRRLDLHDN